MEYDICVYVIVGTMPLYSCMRGLGTHAVDLGVWGGIVIVSFRPTWGICVGGEGGEGVLIIYLACLSHMTSGLGRGEVLELFVHDLDETLTCSGEGGTLSPRERPPYSCFVCWY